MSAGKQQVSQGSLAFVGAWTAYDEEMQGPDLCLANSCVRHDLVQSRPAVNQYPGYGATASKSMGIHSVVLGGPTIDDSTTTGDREASRADSVTTFAFKLRDNPNLQRWQKQTQQEEPWSSTLLRKGSNMIESKRPIAGDHLRPA